MYPMLLVGMMAGSAIWQNPFPHYGGMDSLFEVLQEIDTRRLATMADGRFGRGRLAKMQQPNLVCMIVRICHHSGYIRYQFR